MTRNPPLPSSAFRVPVISSLAIVTSATSSFSTLAMKSVNVRGAACFWSDVDSCHTRAPMTTRTIQKTRLLRVEFKTTLPRPVPQVCFA